MNMEMITLEDCLLNFEINNTRTVINDGQVIDFEYDFSMLYNTPYIITNNE